MINKRINNREINEESVIGGGELFEKDGEKMPENEVIEVSEEEKEAQQKENMAMLKNLYEQRNSKMSEIFNEAEKDIKISEKGVKAVSKGLDGIARASYKDRRVLSLEQKDIEDEINKLEYSALEIPENIEGEAPDIRELKKELTEYARDLKGETEELIDKLKSEREAFAERFIKDSIDGIKEHFEKTFQETINGKNAKNIIAYKTEKEIELAAKRFIETGDKADFGFEAILEVSSYKIEEKGMRVNKKFVTGYAINIGGYEKKIRKSDSPLGSSLVSASKRKEMGDITRYDRKGVKAEKIR